MVSVSMYVMRRLVSLMRCVHTHENCKSIEGLGIVMVVRTL